MLVVNNLTFGYKNHQPVVANFSFQVKKGELLCVMGESGTGKSTLLKLIYGLLDATSGTIFWNESQILGPKFNLVPGFEKFKYVAQHLELMPYITVAENIKKHLSRFYPEESEARCDELLEVIELQDFKHEKVKNLSGGQQQRVAIARALAKEPELLLLDEPFSQIDNFKKNNLRRNLFNYLKVKNISCVLSTHDSSDALSFADKMMVIKNQEMIAFDSPSQLYSNPKRMDVASLFDDVNELVIDRKHQLLYSHQLHIVANSYHQAIVKNAYFKGSFWLIEAEFLAKKIWIQHPHFIEKETPVNIAIHV